MYKYNQLYTCFELKLRLKVKIKDQIFQFAILPEQLDQFCLTFLNIIKKTDVNIYNICDLEPKVKSQNQRTTISICAKSY